MSLKISVKNKRYQCDFELHQKITVVIGESGKGKTVLVRALLDNSGAYKVNLSNNGFRIVVLSLRDYEAQLFFYKGKSCVFVIDDEDFMYAKNFADYVKADKSSYFLLISRLDAASVNGGTLAELGFSAKEIYRFKADGAKHWFERVYNYPKVVEAPDSKLIDVCFVEDATTGYEFFRRIFKRTISTKGKTCILQSLKENLVEIKGKAVFLAVDMAGAGFYISEAVRYCRLNGISIYLLKSYESFEYLVLLSNMFRYDQNSLDNENLLQYATLEQKCTDILSELTNGKPNKYRKDSKSTCYYLTCCNVKRSQKCDRGVAGDKVSAMLQGTLFEVFLTLRQVQEGDEIC